MSALGQKRTCAPQQAMSALHPIATTKADIGRINFCPAYLVATEKIGNLASEEIGYLKKLEPRQNLARLRTLKSL
jgi:hypothetical protein